MTNVHQLFPALIDVRVPEELRELPAWVTWKRELRPGEEKARKVPYWADGNRRYGEQGGPLDRSRLVTFEAARDAAIAREHDGVGFAPLADFGYTFLDFDKCVDADGKLPDEVMAIVGRTYCEYSPSGTGVRAVVKGDLGNHKSHATAGQFGFETFSSKGYVTFTGNALPICNMLGYENHVAEVDENTRQFAEVRFGRSDRSIVTDDFMAGREPPLGLTVSEMQNLLSYLDPSMGREPWLRVGMALHHETQGDDTGLDLWDSWSSEGQQYQGTDDLRYQWERMEQRPGRRSVTMASIIAMAKEQGYISAGVRWAPPRQLPKNISAVPPMTVEMLPAELRLWLLDIAERMNVPLDFVAIPAMVMLGAVVGRKLVVRPELNTDWSEPGNLWGAIIAPPGAMKSPAVSQVFEPITKLEEEAKRANKEAEIAHEAKLMAHKVERDRALKEAKSVGGSALEVLLMPHAQEPTKPKLKRYITSDATVEKLGEICADNPNGVLYHRDELPSLLFDLQREEKVSSRGFLLSGWSGMSSYTFDRISRGMIHVEAVNISLFGTAQPQRMAKLVADAAEKLDDGMVQRLQLLAWPDMSQEWKLVDRQPDQQAREAAFACCRRLADLVPEDVSAEHDDLNPLPYIRLSPDAYHAFNAYREDLEKRLRSGALSGLLTGHLSKFRGLVPRVALILHLASRGSGPVSLEAMQAALTWAAYLEGHARRVYASPEGHAAQTADLLLARIERGELGSQFTRRDILQKNWSGLGDPQEVGAALALLASHDWLRLEQVKSRGRPTERYHVNPAAPPAEQDGVTED